MKEQIIKMYADAKTEKRKGILISIGIYVIMICLVSIFLGSPFPHREKILFFETIQDGWIQTDFHWLIICAIVGVAVGLLLDMFKRIKNIRKLNRILLQDCDAKKYLETIEFAVSYGKGLSFRGMQESLYKIIEQFYVLALTVNLQFEKAAEYLDKEWVGKRSSRIYRLRKINLELVRACYEGDVTEYNRVYEKAPFFKKRRLINGQKNLLNQQYSMAVELLSGEPERIPYNEVSRAYFLAMSYLALGKDDLAEPYLKYVTEHGNTMPCRQKVLDKKAEELF